VTTVYFIFTTSVRSARYIHFMRDNQLLYRTFITYFEALLNVEPCSYILTFSKTQNRALEGRQDDNP